MTRWKQVERFIDKTVPTGHEFTSRQYATTVGISFAEASEHIQAYLAAQRGAKSKTKYVLRRAVGTRTHSARWLAGDRALDARRTAMGFSNDVKLKWMAAVQPDIERIAAINPAAAKRVANICDATLDGALKVLEAAVRA